MKRTFHFGKIAYASERKTNAVDVEIELQDDKAGRPVFTACAGIWNNLHTDWVCGGQCLDSLNEYKSLRTNPTFAKIYGLWKRNHLNAMNAGTVEQEKWLRENGYYDHYDYTKACEGLKSAGLYEVPHPETGKPYKYGHGWVYRAISTEDMTAILELFAT